MVDDGGIGTRASSVRCGSRRSPNQESGDWYADRSKSGGVLLDLAIRDFDYLRWTLGGVALD